MQYIKRVPLSGLRLTHYKTQYPQAGRFFYAASGFSFLYGIKSHFSKNKAEKEVAFRKSQLAKPVYEIRDEELVNPPWNQSNLHEWLYRPVRITGRPIHGRATYVPRQENGLNGYEYIVPFVTKENEDQSVQEGYLVSLGFIPYQWKEIPVRMRLENVEPQTFDCVVTQSVELQNHGFLEGNTYIREQRFSWADLEKIAKETGFQNQDKVNNVLLERVALNTPLDERDARTQDVDADHRQPYPYIKTRSGALNWHGNMPWDWQAKQNLSFGSSVAFGAVGLALYLLK